MQTTLITVEFRRQLSDGHDGSETAAVHVSATLDEEEDPDAVGALLAARARRLVTETLAQSTNGEILRGLGIGIGGLSSPVQPGGPTSTDLPY